MEIYREYADYKRRVVQDYKKNKLVNMDAWNIKVKFSCSKLEPNRISPYQVLVKFRLVACSLETLLLYHAIPSLTKAIWVANRSLHLRNHCSYWLKDPLSLRSNLLWVQKSTNASSGIWFLKMVPMRQIKIVSWLRSATAVKILPKNITEISPSLQAQTNHMPRKYHIDRHEVSPVPRELCPL